MIRLQGARRLTFTFPADLTTAFDFYCTTVDQLASFLPHIELLKTFAPDHALLAYHARELATYDIQMVCEVAVECDRPNWVIRVVTRENGLRIKPSATLNQSLGRGWYESESRFEPAGDHTRVEFTLNLSGELPTPKTMRIVPERVVNRIANAITGQRIEEIARGFIENSVTAYAARRQ